MQSPGINNKGRHNRTYECKRQFGFLLGRSTILQLVHVMDEWTDILDAGGTIDVCYMDFMKAFDKVPHRRPITKLHNHGIQGKFLDWIRS